ncbi:extracellular solute-binding protein [Methanothermococcus sp. SCGC AD-155-K20]|nr:extracellular solute-binding protein [Methanothermococcus sp. SCGC AD-155-K20]
MKRILAIILGLCLIIPMVSLSGCTDTGTTQTTGGETQTTGGNTQNTGGNTQTTSGTTQKVIQLRTTGASFPKNQIKTWIAKYQKINPNVKIEYQGGGSGQGQKDFLKGLTHIGRSDTPVKESMWKKFKETGDQPLQFPEIVGAVVITYNVPEIGNHNLSTSYFFPPIDFFNLSLLSLMPLLSLLSLMPLLSLLSILSLSHLGSPL